MVGTPKSNEFFTQEIPLARRSLGLEWAISKIQKENGVVNWRGIRDLTNLSKANYLRTISYFENKNIEICSRIREGQGRYCVQIQKWI